MVTDFRNRVLNVVSKIKSGKTLTYKQVAKLAGSPGAYRAVGNVLNGNYNRKIPCHRVVRSDGSPGGYNRGAKIKVAILKREGSVD
jgi:O-6-methylguanine DNA methyltransferase